MIAENGNHVLQNDETDQTQSDTKQDAGIGQLHETPLQLSLDISKSTQFLSALLLISPMIPQGLDIHITSEKTDGSYIRITRKMLADAGVEVKYGGKNYRIDPKAVYQKNIIRSNRMFRQRVIFMRQLRSQAAGHL